MTLFGRRPWPIVCGVCVLVVLVAGAYWERSALFESVGRWLDVGEPATPADWVFLLPGDLETRPFAAASLISAGYAERILIPTNVRTLETSGGDAVPGHEALRKILVARGVPVEAVEILDAETDSTFGDASALAAALEKHPGKRVTLVTNDFHTRRTRWVFHNVLDNKIGPGQVRILGVPAEHYGADDWWRTKEGFEAYAFEYIKLAAYYLAYGRGWRWFGGGVLAVILAVRYTKRLRCRRMTVGVPVPTES